jgi:hypothetical protein
MNTHDAWYATRLYPLQDKVLGIIAGCSTAMYLTGGTLLSREYYHHRYSDDLDLFCNDDPGFAEASERILDALRHEFGNIIVGTTAASFVRLFISDDDVELKVDLVNDIPWRAGMPERGTIFPAIDTVRNILSNKISALTRREAKDMADILWIARNTAFHWPDIIDDARKKDLWVDELDVSSLIESFPVEEFGSIRWIGDPDLEQAAADLRIIAEDITFASMNRLVR